MNENLCVLSSPASDESGECEWEEEAAAVGIQPFGAKLNWEEYIGERERKKNAEESKLSVQTCILSLHILHMEPLVSIYILRLNDTRSSPPLKLNDTRDGALALWKNNEYNYHPVCGIERARLRPIVT